MSQTSTCQGEVAKRPGELMHLVAGGLTSHGLSVTLPSRVDDRRLRIPSSGGRCTLTVEDNGLVTWDWRPAAAGRADPKQLADMVCALLTGQAGELPRQGDAYDSPTLTLKGIVGRELAARGLTVHLELFEDLAFYDVFAVIVVASPGSEPDAHARLADDGWLGWECDYGFDAPLSTGYAAPVISLEEVAADVVARVIAALSVAGTGPAGQRQSRIRAGGRRAWSQLRWLASGWWWWA